VIGDVDRHGSQGIRPVDSTGNRVGESEHVWPLSHMRETMTNPDTGRSAIPSGRGTAVDRSLPTVILQRPTSRLKTPQDNQALNAARAQRATGQVSSTAAAELGPGAAWNRTQQAAASSGAPVPAGARAALIGEVDAAHADPGIQRFFRDPANAAPGASAAEIDAALERGLTFDPSFGHEMIEIAAPKGSTVKSLFKGNFTETIKNLQANVAKVESAGIWAGVKLMEGLGAVAKLGRYVQYGMAISGG
jgi:hypothetical protein